MKLIDGTLYLTWSDSGINPDTLKKARTRGTSGYIFVKCPTLGNLVQFDALPPQHKEPLLKQYGGDLYAYYYNKGFEIHLPPGTDAYEYYRTVKLNNGKSLAADYINKYTTYARVMDAVVANKALIPDAMAYLQANNICNVGNVERFKKNVRNYVRGGFSALISGNLETKNAAKITEEVSDWLIAMYALPVKYTFTSLAALYLTKAAEMQWPPLSESGIKAHLSRKDIQPLWYMGRHGKEAYTIKYGIQHKLKRAAAPHRLWMSDGTGLNFESKDENMGRVYWVMDDYSEVILGYSYRKDQGETHQDVYRAAKMALQFATVKPEEWRYDNASAHKKLQPFFSKIATKHAPTKPYSGSSKTIEPVTYRFQKQLMSKWWFFTGQNRGARTLDNRQNTEFVDKFAKQLPTFEETIAVFAAEVEAWNNAAHYKTGIPRLQMLQTPNPAAKPFGLFDMVEAFAVETTLTYTNRGVNLTIGKHHYEFEVQVDNLPDLAFRGAHIGEKMIVKYDPDDLSYVMLYAITDNGAQYLVTAEPMAESEYAPNTAIEVAKVKARQAITNAEIEIRERELEQLQQRTGISPAKLVQQQNEQIKRLTRAEKHRQDDAANNRRTVKLYDNYEEEDELKVVG